MQNLNLETRIEAKFVSATPLSPEEQIKVDQLNAHLENICARLQKSYGMLILDMLEMKRIAITEGK